MRTEDLISVMTMDARPVNIAWLDRATAGTALVSLGVVVLLVLATLGARPDLAMSWITGAVIAKMAFGGSLAGVALVVFQRSLRPGLRPARGLWLSLLPIALAGGWALLTLAQEPVVSWSALTFGRNWRTCLVVVPLYALVPSLLFLVVARRGASTDGRLTGASAGIASAGLAIMGYSLHCSDDTVPFLATWYSLAAVAVTALSMLIMPRFLRW
ncbi:NrsF family protein [Bosea sp. PAMC 26642]|uniref:NrsF family protein n=1 Tax=Bosea sp. (strain PAMC 26642) TaxID=1792307 RepID=UPI0007705970|nr:DUF1109 domain-containing protein [Bosea sp. PAMC 26642]AMJ59627.1 hypothetical protein AXW83_04290 [Bosea sp. PAMC 26642]